MKTNAAKIRVSGVGVYESLTTYTMPSTFKIHPKLVLSSPLTTDLWTVNTTQLIKWNQTQGNSVSFVKLHYDTSSGGGGYAGVIDDSGSLPVTGQATCTSAPPCYVWTVPNIIGNNVRIRVMDAQAGFEAVNDEPGTPNGNFKVKGTLSLNNPKDNITWLANTTTNNISWNFAGSMTVDVSYDLTNLDGDQWTAIQPASSIATVGQSGVKTAPWTMPLNATNNARIRLFYDHADNALDLETIGTLFKVGASFNITEPESGAPVDADSTTTKIKWNTTNGAIGVNKVKLEYTNNGDSGTPSWLLITTNASNSGQYTWNPIPKAYNDLNTTTHKIRISQFDPVNTDSLVVNQGDGFFPILGKLTLTKPTGSESWSANSTQTIEWTKLGDIHAVDVWYSAAGTFTGDEIKINDAAPWNGTAIDISVSGEESGTYSIQWYISPSTPLTTGDSGKIKVVQTDPADTTVEALGPTTNIEVKGSLTLYNPTGTGIALRFGGPAYKIQWKPFGAIQNVELEYSVNGGEESEGSYSSGLLGGQTWPASTGEVGCTPDAPAVACYRWTVPNAIGTGVRIRVRDANNSTVKDESSDNFEIYGSIVVNAPITGTTWYVDSTGNQIKWTPTGSYNTSIFPLVEFHYSTNGSDYSSAVAPDSQKSNTATGVQGTALWTIPNIIGTNVTVRARIKNSPTTVQDVSDIITVAGKITDITSPVAGETWFAQDADKVITWTAVGSVANVRIEYFDGAGWNDVAASSGGHGGGGGQTYPWGSGMPKRWG